MTLSAFASGQIQEIERRSPDSEDRDHIQSPAAATSRQDLDMGRGGREGGEEHRQDISRSVEQCGGVAINLIHVAF